MVEGSIENLFTCCHRQAGIAALVLVAVSVGAISGVAKGVGQGEAASIFRENPLNIVTEARNVTQL